MDMVLVARRGARASSPRSPASPSRGDLAGRTGAVPAVQCVRESVGAELPGRWRATDWLLSRRRLGPRRFVLPVLVPRGGVRVWGGTPSRLAYFAFEVTGIDSTATNLNPTSPTRAAILDTALRWLASVSTAALDRDHPDVNVTAPNGGVFSGPSIQLLWTATAYGAGVAISNFTLSFSEDGGVTWNPIVGLPGSARSYMWDVNALPNGPRYLVRIATQDDGTPSLGGSDVTDGTFSLASPGGDTEGPTLRTGTVRVSTRPPGTGYIAHFRGKAEDRTRHRTPKKAWERFRQIPRTNTRDTRIGLTG